VRRATLADVAFAALLLLIFTLILCADSFGA
jgi:hypothetical protein